MDRIFWMWLTAAVTAMCALVCGTMLWIHGPADAQAWIAGTVATVAAFFGPILVAWLGHDANRNGIPDWVERITAAMGLGRARDLRRKDGPSSDSIGVGVAMLFVAASCVAAQGCGASSQSGSAGAPTEVRVVLDEAARAIVEADRLVQTRVAMRGARAQAEMTTRIELGRFGADTPEAIETRAMRWYDAQMQPYDTAVRVLEAGAASLRSSERWADAWDAGTLGGQDAFVGVLACSVSALAEVPPVLTAVGVPVPDIIAQWTPLVSRWAASECMPGDPPPLPTREGPVSAEPIPDERVTAGGAE